jgi:hypothetical protein
LDALGCSWGVLGTLLGTKSVQKTTSKSAPGAPTSGSFDILVNLGGPWERAGGTSQSDGGPIGFSHFSTPQKKMVGLCFPDFAGNADDGKRAENIKF